MAAELSGFAVPSGTAATRFLLTTGFSEAEVGGVLGGNYARVFNATMAG